MSILSAPWVKKAAPWILTGVAGAGVVGTAVLAAKATPKALDRLEEAEKEKGEELTTWEKFKVAAPSYIPTAGVGAVTLSSIAGMAVLNNKQQVELSAVIAGGNQIINRISRKYGTLREEVEKKDPDILKDFDKKTLDDQWEEYVQERMKKKVHCWLNGECLPIDDSCEWGETRMFAIEYGNGLSDENGHEMIFFEATPGDVLCAFYNLNGIYQQEGVVSVNELFSFLGLPSTELGHRLTWDIDWMLDEWATSFIDFCTTDMPLEDDTVPSPAVCTIIQFNIPPMAEGYSEGMEIADCFGPTE